METGDGGEDSVFLGSCAEEVSSFPFGCSELHWGPRRRAEGPGGTTRAWIKFPARKVGRALSIEVG